MSPRSARERWVRLPGPWKRVVGGFASGPAGPAVTLPCEGSAARTNWSGSPSGSEQDSAKSSGVATPVTTRFGLKEFEKHVGARLKSGSIVIVTGTGSESPTVFEARRVKLSVPVAPAAAV